jgi:signal transduction histidine kinase
MNISLLKDAFQSFSTASKSIESYYELLQKKIDFLTSELEKRNSQLNAALSELEKANNFLNAVLYNIEEMIIVLDSTGKITMINKAAEKKLQLNPGKVRGVHFDNIGFSLLEDSADTFLTVNGNRYNVIVSISQVVDYEGTVRGRVILIRDITRLRELEIQGERNQRLISMGEMAAKIVHEIRNPLCSIELYASMLCREMQNSSHKELAAGISESVSNLNAVLNNMSLFAASPKKPAMRPLHLNKLIDSCIQMIMPMINSSGAKIQKSCLDCQIDGDEELLKQVFLNLMINALQSKPYEGFNQLIEIAVREEGNFIVMDIRDNGIGIENEHLERIFDPFFTTKDSGTGLGLSISARIMQLHDGYIKVKSRQGMGSCFSLYFKNKQK